MISCGLSPSVDSFYAARPGTGFRTLIGRAESRQRASLQNRSFEAYSKTAEEIRRVSAYLNFVFRKIRIIQFYRKSP